MPKHIIPVAILSCILLGIVAYGGVQARAASGEASEPSATLPLTGDLASIYWTVPAHMPPSKPKSEMLKGFARGDGRTFVTSGGDAEAMIQTLKPTETATATVYSNYVVFEFKETQTVIPLERIVEVNFSRKSEQDDRDILLVPTVD